MPHEIFIYDQIGSDWFGDGVSDKEIAKELKAHEGEDITLRINSPGGSVFDGMAIFNAIKAHTGKVTAQVDGLAASAASVIALAADEVLMGDGTFMMIHSASVFIGGNADELMNYVNLLQKMDREILKIYNSKTGIEESVLAEMLKAETWMNAEEAVQKGFADALTKPSGKNSENTNKPKNLAEFKLLNQYKNVPETLKTLTPALSQKESAPIEETQKLWKVRLQKRLLALTEIS